MNVVHVGRTPVVLLNKKGALGPEEPQSIVTCHMYDVSRSSSGGFPVWRILALSDMFEHRLTEMFDVHDWLRIVVAEPRIQHRFPILWKGFPGYGNDWKARRPLMDEREHLKSIHLRHHEIQNNQIEGPRHDVS